MMSAYSADFETITDPNDCRVWAYGICEIDNPDNFIYGNSIDDLMEWASFQYNPTLYFHNLKFDGEFILCWLFENGYTHVTNRKDLRPKTFTTLISDKGQFYSLEICHDIKNKKRNSIKILDSLKILPFSVESIAECFGLPLSKLKIDYDQYREVGHHLTDEEVEYIRADVEIVARALKILFDQGLTQMTQGSNALADYKHIVGKKNFNKWFPIPDYDYDIRQAYKGGFTFLQEKYRDVDLGEGLVFDINSLYPYVMYECNLPYGEGIFFHGKYEKDNIYNLYVQMFTCQFELKEGHIPTIQLKNNSAFVPTQYLSSSNGEDVTLCLTNVDLELFFKHYDVYNITYHNGWKFKSTNTLFKAYIDKWVKIKNESTLSGNKAMRTLAKLMLNALYGKFALNPRVRSKIPHYSDGMIKYSLGKEEMRDPIYIPVATFITAWARFKTISAAQSVYDRFVYADTDSLHLIGTDIPEGLEIDPVKLGAWKHEATFKRARFLRQKSYIEEIDGSLKITCAGMPSQCYQYVTWDNFHPNANYKGKLRMSHVKGGIVLQDTPFSIKSA